MKKTEIYELAIAAIISNESLEMGEKIAVLKELFKELDMAEIMERPSRNEFDKTAETLLAGMPPEPVE